MSEKYTTDELVKNLVSLEDFGEVNLSVGGVDGLIKAIISRLRNADEIARLYHEILYEVSRAYPNETRHETAMRYIRKAETPSSIAAQYAKAIADHEETT